MDETRPNILFLMSDQHRWDALGCVNPVVQTPHLDGLARRGIRFSQAVCNAPMCVPSRYSLMLGLYPSQCGVRHNTQTIPEDRFLPALTLPQRLAARGYQTVGLGKTHWYPGDVPTDAEKFVPTGRGFEIRAEPRDVECGATYEGEILMGREEPEAWARYCEEMRACQCGPESITGFTGHPSAIPGDFHREGWVTRQAVKFLREDRAASRPFFLYVSFDNPHAGFNVPPGYEERYRLEDIVLPEQPPWQVDPPGHVVTDSRAAEWLALPEETRRRSMLRYYALCTYVDDCFGRVLREIEEAGELDNTLVVFTSDHGEMLGERNGRLTKYCFYESSVRVPLILAGAGVPPDKAGTVDDRPAELVDVLPTLVEAPPELPGRSLLAPPCRLGSFCEMHGSGYETVGGPPGPDWRTKPSLQAAPSWMWRTRYWKLILRVSGDARDAMLRIDESVGELYNLRDDPQEWRNLYEEPNLLPVREQLTRELLLHMACVLGRFPRQAARPRIG
jgi:arylsulfatase A-like enzyme